MNNEEDAFVRPRALEAGDVFLEKSDCDTLPPVRRRDTDGVDANGPGSGDVLGDRFLRECSVWRGCRTNIADDLAAGPFWNVCS